MATDSDQARGFAARLRDAMLAKGLTSDRSRSGVDVTALARAAGVSYAMASRYAQGEAIPRPDALEKIAAWLEIDSASLAWGTPSPGSVDLRSLARCLQAVQEAQRAAAVSLSPEQTARVVAQLYEEMNRGAMPSAPSLAALLRAMKGTA